MVGQRVLGKDDNTPSLPPYQGEGQDGGSASLAPRIATPDVTEVA